MSALATLSASRACAQTLLFESLRINAFNGAVPHVLLVIDSVPCVQQKALIEGYRQVLEEYNGSRESAQQLDRASRGDTFIALNCAAKSPCGSSGLFSTFSNKVESPSGNSISYSIVPFSRSSFPSDVKRLQSFFRQCGGEAISHSLTQATSDKRTACPRWTDDRLSSTFYDLAAYLQPLSVVQDEAGSGQAPGASVGDSSDPLVRHISEKQAKQFSASLRASSAPLRELLGVILIQQNAFQNELKQYRLRLSLFDMGLRVAEHCHLKCMSLKADALAAAGRYTEALADDEVYSYARSCSLRPSIAECIGKAIADSIDGYAWKRASWGRQGCEGGVRGCEGSASTSSSTKALSLAPAESLKTCLRDASVWKLLRPGSLIWKGLGMDVAQMAPGAEDNPQDWAREPIVGVGEPLKIICKEDPEHVLVFSGGMEDCLMNTGHYPAASEAARNEVHSHRLRFVGSTNDAPSEETESRPLLDSCALPTEMQKDSFKAPLVGDGVGHGGVKKKEYLAILKEKRQKSNKPLKIDSDEDEHTGVMRRGGSPSARERDGSRITASIGGTFPIGEVITESFDLSQLNGTCEVFAFPDRFKHVALCLPKPFLLTIEHGCVAHVSEDAPEEFVQMLSLVEQCEGECWVRELGIGLNPFTGLSHILSDVTSFERQWGIHLSLGKRHPLFVKQKRRQNSDGSTAAEVHIKGPVLKRKEGKYHIDVFINAAKLQMGNFEVDFTKGIAVR